MKTCKFCNAELPKGTTVCPSCGKDNADTLSLGKSAIAIAAVVAVVILVVGVFLGMNIAVRIQQEDDAIVVTEAVTTEATTEVTEAAAEATEAATEVTEAVKDATEVATEATEAAVAKAAEVTTEAAEATTEAAEATTEVTEDATEATEATTEETEPTVPADGNPDDVTCKGTYTADDETVIAARDTVVATAGEYELTLGELQVYYWMEVRNFMSQYGAYAAYFGLDIYQSLDTQVCAVMEESRTWQQFFLESALNAWHNYRTMAAEADQNGFEMTDLQKDAIENAAAQLDEAAIANGYESGAAMVKTSLGAAAELEDYVYFMELYYKANGYYNQLAEEFQPTDEEMDAYYAEHAEGYEASGITKDSKTVDVRHILIYPEGADGTNIFTEEFSEEAWAAGEEAAKALLEQFLAGEQTEDAFAALANENSQDPGSNQNGGLYEGVTEGEMVTAFNDWCFDSARQVGDTGIVKTEYGYHVMYFSGSNLLWKQYVQSDFSTEKASAKAEEVTANCPITIKYSEILLALADLA